MPSFVTKQAAEAMYFKKMIYFKDIEGLDEPLIVYMTQEEMRTLAKSLVFSKYGAYRG